jgi:hypothetical protein
MNKRDAARAKPGAIKPAAPRIDPVLPQTDNARPSAQSSKQQPSSPPRAFDEEDVRLRAYLKWEAAGRPEGNDLEFWLGAERELRGS